MVIPEVKLKQEKQIKDLILLPVSIKILQRMFYQAKLITII